MKAIAIINADRRSGVNLSVSQSYEKRTLAGLVGLESDGIVTMQSFPSPLSLCPSSEISKLKSAALNQLQVATEQVEDIMPVLDIQTWYVSYQKENPCSFHSFRVPSPQ